MHGRLHPLALTLLLMGSVAAGCITGELPLDDDAQALASADAPRDPHAVIGIVDTGINPYHVDFRDDSPLAYVHPSEYLPGFPADAVAVNLTLDAPDLETALAADLETWASLEPRTLYWFPGTKVLGYSTLDAEETSEQEPGLLFSTGHGTMTASRAAGNAYSLCPECRVVAVQGFNGESVTWASEQPWIDAQSNSWSPLVVFQQADAVQEAGLSDAFEEAAARHVVFGSAGNGLMGKLGVAGHPSFTRSTSGPKGVVSVGGHDNGEVVLWTGSWPHVAADACDNWAAVGDTLDEYAPDEGGGTSSASPYAAGEAARLILEARRILGTYDGVMEGGLLAATGGATAVAEGPLADGDLTLAELKRVLFTTAVARPVKTEHDGARCGTASPYGTHPVAWEDVPEDVPTYAFIGYGQISVDSLEHALRVLRGEAPLPERPLADKWHAHAETLRETYNELPETG